ncbi:MAG TPA: hypothetical protein VKB38_04315 [Terracidiphilus sp.]|nr:hypothetical protein [Terracidiphilus sp.]
MTERARARMGFNYRSYSLSGPVAMRVMVVAVMVFARGKSCRRHHHQKQGCKDELFHGLNVASSELPWKAAASKENRGLHQDGKQSDFGMGRKFCCNPGKRRLIGDELFSRVNGRQPQAILF